MHGVFSWLTKKRGVLQQGATADLGTWRTWVI